jgi:choline dehydrogenase
MYNGLRRAQSLVGRLRPSFFSLELLPGPLFSWCRQSEQFRRYFSLLGTTYFHPCGTCSMDHFDEEGEAVAGVVTDRLRVKGLRNLRVADASVIPHIPNFAIAKLVMLIGLRAADFIREDAG